MSEEELIKETMMLDYRQLVMHNVYMIKENKRLHSIIKEVREYVTTEQLYTDYQWSKEQYKKILKDILEILEKENI